MTRGNQRELARAKNQKKNAGQPKQRDDGLTHEQRKQRSITSTVDLSLRPFLVGELRKLLSHAVHANRLHGTFLSLDQTCFLALLPFARFNHILQRFGEQRLQQLVRNAILHLDLFPIKVGPARIVIVRFLLQDLVHLVRFALARTTVAVQEGHRGCAVAVVQQMVMVQLWVGRMGLLLLLLLQLMM
uniref:4F5 domain-containing protein n=1 Tax=Anopheles stephensi TaxID=30069 RepID=A0A182YMV8_ANOST